MLNIKFITISYNFITPWQLIYFRIIETKEIFPFFYTIFHYLILHFKYQYTSIVEGKMQFYVQIFRKYFMLHGTCLIYIFTTHNVIKCLFFLFWKLLKGFFFQWVSIFSVYENEWEKNVYLAASQNITNKSTTTKTYHHPRQEDKFSSIVHTIKNE